jgi:hypothetical protein
LTKFSDILRDITSSEGDAVGSLQIILLAKGRLPTDITFSQEEAASRYYLHPQRLSMLLLSRGGYLEILILAWERKPIDISFSHTFSHRETAFRYYFQPQRLPTYVDPSQGEAAYKYSF